MFPMSVVRPRLSALVPCSLEPMSCRLVLAGSLDASRTRPVLLLDSGVRG